MEPAAPAGAAGAACGAGAAFGAGAAAFAAGAAARCSVYIFFYCYIVSSTINCDCICFHVFFLLNNYENTLFLIERITRPSGATAIPVSSDICAATAAAITAINSLLSVF